MLLCIIIFSEVCTSMAVVKLMKKGSKSKTGEVTNANDGDNHFLRATDVTGKNCKRSGRATRSSQQAKTDTRSGDEGSGH